MLRSAIKCGPTLPWRRRAILPPRPIPMIDTSAISEEAIRRFRAEWGGLIGKNLRVRVVPKACEPQQERA